MKKMLTFIFGLALFSGTLLLTGCACKHEEWTEATCVTPKTCVSCEITEGEPIDHEWTEADCENPKTCASCGLTEGEPTDHEWTNANCINPKTCASCGLTEGEPTGEHTWQDATMDNPKTCKICDETEGFSLNVVASNINYAISKAIEDGSDTIDVYFYGKMFDDDTYAAYCVLSDNTFATFCYTYREIPDSYDKLVSSLQSQAELLSSSFEENGKKPSISYFVTPESFLDKFDNNASSTSEWATNSMWTFINGYLAIDALETLGF
ncbi:MAG: hypothetical protein K2H29_00110 [Oscillospiraceae bacterium]|nr:hypothetical protein [Oscillospiraceae bacterium]